MSLFSSALPTWAAEPAAPVISQLQVQKKTPEELNVNLFGGEGVRFVIIFNLPEHYILGVDEGASKLTSAVDDKGTDLTENTGDKWISDFFSKVNKSHHKIAIPATLGSVPATGATSIAIKGEIVLRCGKEEKSDTIKPFDLTQGLTTQYGEHTLKIAIADKKSGGFWGGNEDKDTQSISVTMNQGADWAKTFEFVDEQGKIIKSESDGSFGMGGMVTRNYKIAKDVKTLGVKITYFDQVEIVRQPIDLKVAVGL